MLVVEHKVISYDYFMDRLQEYEVHLLIDYLPWCNKIDWEQTRMILWGVLSPYLKNKKSPKDILPLETDNKTLEYEKDEPLEDKNIDDIRNKILNIWGKK